MQQRTTQSIPPVSGFRGSAALRSMILPGCRPTRARRSPDACRMQGKLLKAAKRGDAIVVRRCLEAGVDPNCTDTVRMCCV
jgi:hypothetical protein